MIADHLRLGYLQLRQVERKIKRSAQQGHHKKGKQAPSQMWARDADAAYFRIRCNWQQRNLEATTRTPCCARTLRPPCRADILLPDTIRRRRCRTCDHLLGTRDSFTAILFTAQA